MQWLCCCSSQATNHFIVCVCVCVSVESVLFICLAYPLAKGRNDRRAYKPRIGSGPNEGINTIEYTAVLGEQITKILEPGITFQHGSRQVTQ